MLERRWRVLFILALALALGFIGYTLLGPGGGSKEAHLNNELSRILEGNRLLAEENRRLALEVEALKKRRDYLEKVTRDELGLVKGDEMVFHLPDSEKPVSSANGGSRAEREP